MTTPRSRVRPPYWSSFCPLTGQEPSCSSLWWLRRIFFGSDRWVTILGLVWGSSVAASPIEASLGARVYFFSTPSRVKPQYSHLFTQLPAFTQIRRYTAKNYVASDPVHWMSNFGEACLFSGTSESVLELYTLLLNLVTHQSLDSITVSTEVSYLIWPSTAWVILRWEFDSPSRQFLFCSRISFLSPLYFWILCLWLSFPTVFCYIFFSQD
jgi:hypothetical protein